MQVGDGKVRRPLISLYRASRDLSVGPDNVAVRNEASARQIPASVIAPVDLKVGASLDNGVREGHAVVVTRSCRQLRDDLIRLDGCTACHALRGADGYVEVEARTVLADVEVWSMAEGNVLAVDRVRGAADCE